MWGVWPTLTYAQGVLLELWGEVGGAGHAVEISLQHIPTHLKVEWVAELGWHLEGGGTLILRYKCFHLHSGIIESSHLSQLKQI